ncbi:uncharacterized protein LOC106441944 [Brassica napus]|uniref:uncharacterized protein LOC106441944 n=1 Tax=Brassica napus TaxID=3708 RepID=UPI0006AA88E9|nr:uncharacterized protein LOC106441944 [Brassica napus]
MDAYLKLIQDITLDFNHFALTRIPHSKNTQADALAALASSSDSGLRRVIPDEFIEHPSIGPLVVANLIRAQIENAEEVKYPPEENVDQSEYGCDSPWLEPIRAYIIKGTLPTENWAARKIKTQAARYVTVEGEIYKWRFSGPLMTCAEGEKARRVMEETARSSHGSAKNAKGTRRQSINPQKSSRPSRLRIPSCDGPWISPKQKCFLLVLTDFFSKWVEADSYASIKDVLVENFVWKNIITRHGCNGQAETINKTVLDGLKKCLGAKKGRWAEELEGVLWSHRTTLRRPTGETPFALVYGTECMIPAEVEFPGVRRRFFPEREDLNSAMLLDELDLINERRDQALIRIQNYQHAAAKYYNSNVRHRRFKEGDLVLRKVFQNTAERNAGKLGANWKGPYKVIKSDQDHTKSQTCRKSRSKEPGMRCILRNTTTNRKVDPKNYEMA